MKTLLVVLLTITVAKVNAQDHKRMYLKYTDSMMMKHFQRDTTGQNRYIDSMVKYNKMDVGTGKRLK